MNYKPEITRAEFDERQEEIKAALYDVLSEEIKKKEEFTAWLDESPWGQGVTQSAEIAAIGD